jgi:hypothetical protein
VPWLAEGVGGALANRGGVLLTCDHSSGESADHSGGGHRSLAAENPNQSDSA